MHQPHLIEQGIGREELVHGNFLHVLRDTVRLPDGEVGSREYVVHPGAVMVIPMLEDGRVVLERQFRYPVGRVVVEFPAGKLDVGEASLDCARRELAEETGYVAKSWAFAGTLHPLVAYSTEHIDVWFAKGLTSGDQKLDAGEFLEVFALPANELLEWCLSGKVTDGKTLAGALWLQNLLSGKWNPLWLGGELHDVPCPAGPYRPRLETSHEGV